MARAVPISGSAQGGTGPGPLGLSATANCATITPASRKPKASNAMRAIGSGLALVGQHAVDATRQPGDVLRSEDLEMAAAHRATQQGARDGRRPAEIALEEPARRLVLASDEQHG